MKWAVCGELVHLKFFLRKYQMKKVSCPHYLNMLMKLSKHGISYSLKRDPRSISKITFYANLSVSPIDIKLQFLQRIAVSLQNSKIILQSHPTEVIQAKVLVTWITNSIVFEKLSKLCINRANSQIGIKCDFRDWPRITFEAVADAMFAWFHSSFQIMGAWYFFLQLVFPQKKNWDEPVHHKQLISSVWKL